MLQGTEVTKFTSPNRRLFGHAILAAVASAASGPLLAQTPIVAPPRLLLEYRASLMSDSVMVVKLWPQLTEQFLRAALLDRCDVFKHPLAELEWDAKFQSLIAKDARNSSQTPLFKRFFSDPKIKQTKDEWARWPAAKRKEWNTWVEKPGSVKVLKSRRADSMFEIFEKKDWAIDSRTGTTMATPVILLAQALSDLQMRELFDQAVTKTDAALGKQWKRIKPFAEMNRKDTPWLQKLAESLPEHNEAIFESFDELATQQMPDRNLWADGPFSDLPGSKPYVMPSAERKEFEEANFKFRLPQYVPATFAAYCGKS